VNWVFAKKHVTLSPAIDAIKAGNPHGSKFGGYFIGA